MTASWRCLFVVLVTVCAASAHALDKQGSAHGGGVEGADRGVALSGSLMLGAALYNPSYAARPDNTGLALMRYAAHLDTDLIGRRLSIPLDLNFFTDRERSGIAKLSPSEFDLITGLTSTWGLGPTAVEVGARIEHDLPVDRGDMTQTYVDARARFLYSLAHVYPSLGRALRDGDLTGWLTLGWFAYNPSYFARPDNTGRALLRYAVHAELSLWHQRIALGVDTTFFTDKQSDHIARPSELDLTPTLVAHLGDFDLQVAYERDMPIDRGGLVQQFVYALISWSFASPTLKCASP